MCWVLYLAADQPLPLRTFDPLAPAFNVALTSARESAVRVQFSKPLVYSIGAHTGCACGFDRGQANPDHPEELKAAEASLEALRAYLAEALQAAGPLELFACWDGDQGAAPDQSWRANLEHFTSGMSWFPDRTFVEVA